MDELRLLDQSLVPDGTTSEDYTDTDKNLVVTESVLIDDEEILGQYRETPNVYVDDDTEENTEEVESPKNRPDPKYMQLWNYFRNAVFLRRKR